MTKMLGKKVTFPGLLLLPLLVAGVVYLAGCGGGGGGVSGAVGGGGGGGATLLAIEINPAKTSIAMGTARQFAATGIFSDNTVQDLTAAASWTSITPAVATIGDTAGVKGRASALVAGTTTITATYGGKTGSTQLTVTAATLTTVEVSPTNPSIAKGTSRQFNATAIFSDTTKQDITAYAAWSSSTASATITAAGLATGVSSGTTSITASYGGLSGATTLTVTVATLASIEVTPINASIALGTTQQFTAIGVYSDNTTQNLTQNVTWSSVNSGIAVISNAQGSYGLVKSLATGTTTIKATSGSVQGSASLTITSATLAALDVTPAIPDIPAGLLQQFSATGTFSDGTTKDMTSEVIWNSTDAGVATVSNATGSNGLATTLVQGTATITATFGNMSGSTLLTVTPATIIAIEVDPFDVSIPRGSTQQFTAAGILSDDTVIDLTPEVTWSSSATGVATVSNETGFEGIATTIAPGTATITAAYQGLNGSATLTVTPAALVSIAITPVTSSIALGTFQQYNAIGTYSDNSTRDISDSVTWSSTSLSVVVISNTGGETNGLATSTGVGETIIKATSGSIVSNTATLTVTSATLQSITVTPANTTIARKSTQQFTATGIFSDGSVQVLTMAATWSSSATTVAVISNASNSKGLATGVGVGSATITARFGGITGSTTLNVINATLQAIVVTPDNTSISVKSSQQFTATASYTGGISQDITKSVKWTSSKKNIAFVSNGLKSRGLAKAVGTGTTTISATKSGIKGDTILTVIP
jgi:trimeric autotransporter adhesin